MSRKYKFHDNDKLYFISYVPIIIRIYLIDVFVREEYIKVIIDSSKHCQETKKLQIYGWCIMPSHVHMIIGSSKNKMEDILRDTKSFTSTALKTAIKEHPHESRKEWMLWLMERAGKKNRNNNEWSRSIREQQHNKPLEIISQEMFDEKLYYIHQNPVQAGFVIKEEDWKYSSPRDFCGQMGLISLSYS